MSRPVGVTASAIVAILGSLIALLFAVISVASLFVVTTQPKPPNTGQFIVAGALMFAAFAGIGIWTSVGLFRLRPWSRTSIMVFAGLLAAISLFSLIITMAVPMPPDVLSAGTEPYFRRSMAVTFGIPLAIAVWWLIQFNTQSTKAAFASPVAESASTRPLSISIIGWAAILGGASGVYGILAHAPAFLFGAIFTGWIAVAIYVLFGALSVYIGKGLLDLRERARVLAIWWLGFGLVHMGLILLVPSWRHRMLEFQLTLQNQEAPIAFDPGILIALSSAFGAIVAGTAIWFLIRNRAAFVRGESPSPSDSV